MGNLEDGEERDRDRIGLDLVVVNYRTPQDLKEFLDSASKYRSTRPWNLWVVNNSPTPQDRKVADDFVRVHPNAFHVINDNIGYAKAVNMAAQSGTRHVLAVFNADVVLTPRALDLCYEGLLSRPEWAVLGPKQTDGTGKITSAGTFGTRAAPDMRDFRRPDRGQCNDIRSDCVHISGSAMFWKRDIWQNLTACPQFQEVAPKCLGAFLPTDLYYEETFALYHAIEHGYKVGYYGVVEVVHRWHRSIRANPQANASAKFRQSRTYFRQACDHHGIPHD